MPYEPLPPEPPYDPLAPTRLADGLYAGFDGWQVWLTVETSERERAGGGPLIALDAPAVLALMRYAKQCWAPGT